MKKKICLLVMLAVVAVMALLASCGKSKEKLPQGTYRNVQVEIDGEPYFYFMTDSKTELSKELANYKTRFPFDDFLELMEADENLPEEVITKMTQMGAVWALTTTGYENYTNEGILNYYSKEIGSYSVELNEIRVASRKMRKNSAESRLKQSLDYETLTDLMKATFENDVNAAKEIIANGADVNAKDVAGWSALSYAAYNGNTEIARMLLEAGADVNSKSDTDCTPLMEATSGDAFEIAQMLIESGADINAVQMQGSTALMLAADENAIEITKILLDAGADINVQDKNGGWSALMNAVYYGNTEIAQLLIDRGADVNATVNWASVSDLTALMIAMTYDYTDIAQFLIEAGADINAQDSDGTTALMYASVNGRTTSVKKLLEVGAELNLQDDYGVTALMGAAATGDVETVKLLLTAGADVNGKFTDEDGKTWTALTIAEDEGYTEIAELFREAGAEK